MLEKDIEKRVKDYARRNGWLAFKWAGVNQRGVPDDIFINRHGFILFIEFKREGNKPTKLQALRIKQLRDQNCTVFVVDNVAFGKKIIDE